MGAAEQVVHPFTSQSLPPAPSLTSEVVSGVKAATLNGVKATFSSGISLGFALGVISGVGAGLVSAKNHAWQVYKNGSSFAPSALRGLLSGGYHGAVDGVTSALATGAGMLTQVMVSHSVPMTALNGKQIVHDKLEQNALQAVSAVVTNPLYDPESEKRALVNKAQQSSSGWWGTAYKVTRALDRYWGKGLMVWSLASVGLRNAYVPCPGSAPDQNCTELSVTEAAKALAFPLTLTFGLEWMVKGLSSYAADDDDGVKKVVDAQESAARQAEAVAQEKEFRFHLMSPKAKAAHLAASVTAVASSVLWMFYGVPKVWGLLSPSPQAS